MPLTPEKVAQCDARMFAIIHEDIGKRLAEYYAAAVFFNDDKHPAQVNNEIRNALNHLTRARHESDSWSAAEENFKAAMRHVERAQRDCLKLAIIGLFGQLTETFRGIEYYYGAVQPAFSVRKTELIKRRKEAYLKESKGEETIVNILVGIYADALVLGDEIQAAHPAAGRVSSWKIRFLKLKRQGISLFVGFAVGVAASLSAAAIWEKFQTP